MIAKMRKLHLIAMSYERDKVLDALERTEAVEVATHAETEGTVLLPEDGEALRAYLGSLESALELLGSREDAYAAEHKLKQKSGELTVGYAEFREIGGKKEEMDGLVARINALSDGRNALLAEQAKLSREIAAARPYAQARLPFSAYHDTAHTGVRFGILPRTQWDALEPRLEALGPVACEAALSEDTALITVSAYRDVLADAEGLLQEAGFVPCPYSGDVTGEQQLLSLEQEASALVARLGETDAEFHELAPALRTLRIYCDYVRFAVEKAELGEKLRATDRTFLLEAFVPAEREEAVKAVLDGFGALWYEFSDPAEDEPIPTLMENNKVVENFETITNMYSVPDARELDPNTVMAFFYSLFLGFIMADVGYGLMMLLGGGFLYYKNRAKKGGVKSLAGVFAIGGIFAIIWGFLFNSFLGISRLPFTVMPDAQTKMWSLMGIDIPAILIISLLIGLVQIMAGYLCKAAQFWRKGQFFDGLFEGFVWALFSLGALVAVVGLLTVENDGGEVVFQAPILAEIGGIIAAACLVVAVLTAGRHEKFLGKLTKGFGSLYGLINYFTDVLSYIRLYGLMLTGAVIAQVISQYSVQFLTSGSFLIVLGVLLMVVGHVFNLAISLLGAYIHDARLQYVEFFGRFYTGEGRLFTPLGSDKKYISVVG